MYGQGGERTIIDLTAAACRRLMLNAHGGLTCTADADCGDNADCLSGGQCDWYDSDLTGHGRCGTSYSAPTVAGGAVDLIDFYRDTIGYSIDDPGFLTVNLLLMGDRQHKYGGKHTAGYNNLWGAGRFKMRRWDEEGMDGQWEFADFETCVDDGQNVLANLKSGNQIKPDTDVLKAVAYVFDPAHESGGPINDVDLHLEEDVGFWTTRRSSFSSTDEKERIYWDDFSGYNSWRLRISGVDVHEDSTYCGTNSVPVYVAFMWEDSDRDDSGHSTPNGPGTNTDVE